VETEGGKKSSNIDQSLSSELDALAEMKFSFVIACQKFGEYKSNNDPRAQDIIDLMARYAFENMDIRYNDNWWGDLQIFAASLLTHVLLGIICSITYLDPRLMWMDLHWHNTDNI
jgi:hypothetical protein